jgi:glycerophosphoryl diester phosphodiesterase
MSPAHQLQRSARHLHALPGRYLAAVLAVHAAVVLGLGELIRTMMDAAMALSGITGLTDGNVAELLHSPASLTLLIAIAAIATLTTLAYATMVFVVADQQLAGASPSLRTLGTRTFAAMTTLLGRVSALYTVPLLALLVVVIAPFAGFGLFSPLTSGLALPPFIEREFLKTTAGTIGWALVTLVLLYITFRTILALPLNVVAGPRPGRSLRASISATGRGNILLALTLAASFWAFWAISRVSTELLGQLVDVAAPSLPDPAVAITLASLVLTLLSLVGTLFFALLLVGYAREVSGVCSPPAPAMAARGFRQQATRSTASLVRRPLFISAAAITVAAIAGFNLVHTSAAYAGTPGDAIVIGHRGYDSGGVENTIGSLEAAASLNPDLVEVDIQQTGDGGFVASHDSNLLILAGVNKNLYEMTTAEVISTTVRMRGNSGTIPTMAEFVTRAAELEMPLLIEFKLNGHEQPGFVEAALTELDELGAIDSNIYQSTSRPVVAEIKRLRPQLRVGLTIGMLRGDPSPADCDFYTLEQASYTNEFLREAHARRREVYVWTVNGNVAMRSLLRDGVDGLVTDRIDTAERFRALITSGATYSPGDARDVLLADNSWG